MKRILVLLLTLALISGAYAETGIEADTLLPSACIWAPGAARAKAPRAGNTC